MASAGVPCSACRDHALKKTSTLQISTGSPTLGDRRRAGNLDETGLRIVDHNGMKLDESMTLLYSMSLVLQLSEGCSITALT